MNLTAILTCKNRDLNVQYCLASINQCEPRPRVILVDFGSKNSLSKYSKIYDWVEVIRLSKNTRIFHKSRAINIAIRETNTNYICATDVDQIFKKDFFKIVFNHINTNKNLVMCKSWFLKTHPKNMGICPEEVMWQYSKIFQIAKTETNKIHGEGCCIGLPTKWLKKVRGWDEDFIGYGGEDSDIIKRAIWGGFKKMYINGKTNMIHMPHPKKGAYYHKFFTPNKQRFHKKPVGKIVANEESNWGQKCI